MKSKKNSVLVVVLIGISLCIVPSLLGEETTEFLKGKVYSLDRPNLSLGQKLQLALKEFKKSKEGNYYIAGYSFRCWHGINIDGCYTIDSYRVKHEKGELVISRPTHKRRKIFTDFEDVKEEIGILFLTRISGKKTEITDFDIIDLDNTYEFEKQPVYWLGKVDTNESIQFLEGTFDSGDYDIRKKLVFMISLHDSPRTYDFLKGAAVGNYERKIRKNAIFWLGNYKDAKSIKYLKDVLKRVTDSGLRKQIVFAFSLSDKKEAIVEMIKIAKTDSSRKVRKNAIFWLGQKASKESIKALKDVVEDSEDIELKKTAVFAISQLPHEKAVPILIEIAKTNKSLKVRKNAIFWLGQVGNEEALKFFEEILLKKK